jgi:hypothetical protein
MPVYPVVIHEPALVGNYPHMARRDTVVWERFLKAVGPLFVGFAYDVALGGIEPTDATLTPAEVQGWRYNTAAKIDAVGFRREECWVIEVKPSASLSALGQVLGYLILAEREPFTDLPLVPVIVTDYASADVKYVAATLGIDVLDFPEEPALVEGRPELSAASRALITGEGIGDLAR